MLYNTSTITIIDSSDELASDIVHLHPAVVTIGKNEDGKFELRELQDGDFILIGKRCYSVKLDDNIRLDEIGVRGDQLENFNTGSNLQVQWLLMTDRITRLESVKLVLEEFCCFDLSQERQFELQEIHEALKRASPRLLLNYRSVSNRQLRIRLKGYELCFGAREHYAPDSTPDCPLVYRMDDKTRIKIKVSEDVDELFMSPDQEQ